MKRLLPAVAAISLAVSVILLGLAWREIGSLRDEVAQLRKEKAALKFPPLSKEVPAISGKTPAQDANKPSRAQGTAERNGKESPAGAEALLGAGKEQLEKRRAARVALLAQRLKLRPEQLSALEKQSADYSERVKGTFERLSHDEARPPDCGVLMDWMSGRFDLPVNDLLDAEQAKLFTAFDAEDRANRVENLVNMELTELHGQGSIQLSPEQKDKVFEALSGILTAEDAAGDAYYKDDGGFSARIDESLARRREALKSILDATQLENYDRMLEEDRVQVDKTFPSSQETPAK